MELYLFQYEHLILFQLMEKRLFYIYRSRNIDFFLNSGNLYREGAKTLGRQCTYMYIVHITTFLYVVISGVDIELSFIVPPK